MLQVSKSARDRSRTDTSLRTADFESAASTNSATRAGCNKNKESRGYSQRTARYFQIKTYPHPHPTND
jgi:hypothetical protein